ncbi:hypothetical protein ACRALDRAFT_2031306 [Sodiomyces alcalophilus JCM 7366]|uniref:uncharacterized protein n=1 Tax=Sodiomyces alcalophilus JCM 7366 TaxID=591952 RepID=UPI0039B43DBB
MAIHFSRCRDFRLQSGVRQLRVNHGWVSREDKTLHLTSQGSAVVRPPTFSCTSFHILFPLGNNRQHAKRLLITWTLYPKKFLISQNA